MHYHYLKINYDKEALTNFAINATPDQVRWEVLDQEIDYCIGTVIDCPKFMQDALDQLPNNIKRSPVFFKNAPQRPHIDRTRSSAVNFPLNIASKFFVAKEYPSEWFEEHIEYRDPIDARSVGREKQEVVKIFPPIEVYRELYDIKFSIDRPYLLDVKSPHGALNNTDLDRYIMTVGFGQTFAEMKQLLSDKLMDDPYENFN